MKAIFLDLEGVLVTHRTIVTKASEGVKYFGHSPNWGEFVDQTGLKLIVELCKEFHDTPVIVTSTLRGERNTMHIFTRMLIEAGEACNLDIDVMSTNHRGSREDEIDEFVRELDLDRYVVFDDRVLECPNFIRVNPYDGISFKNYADARELLADPGAEVPPRLIFL